MKSSTKFVRNLLKSVSQRMFEIRLKYHARVHENTKEIGVLCHWYESQRSLNAWAMFLIEIKLDQELDLNEFRV